MNFSIGADPEFILEDYKKTLKSAISVVGGKKSKKLKIENNYFFYDNVLAECSIEPSKDKEEFIKNIQKSLRTYSKLVKPYKLTTLSSGYFDAKELLHKDAKKSGCAVEYCAYSLEIISPKKTNSFFKTSRFRTAGGHVHLGTDLGRKHDDCVMLIRMLDLFLGFTSLILDNTKESLQRRKIYGMPGRYRQPSYGVEYRTLGNFWFSSPKLVDLVFDLCEFTINFTKEKGYENFWKVDYEKLNSDEFWNNGGNPSDCHVCYGYDVEKFIKTFKSEIPNNKEITEIVNKYLPKNIINKIKKLSNCKFEMYEEWNLKKEIK